MPQRSARSVLVILFLFACSIPNLASQQTKGTARISGRVTRAETGAPVEKAAVFLTFLNGVGTTATSGVSGAFEFKDIAAGEYRVTANATGLVSVDATPSQPLGVGKLIKVSDGQRLDNVELSVTRMATIDGRVLDRNNAPLSDVPVSLVQMRQISGKPVLVPVSGTGTSLPSNRTDADGKFRFTDLLPGDYYVRATGGPFGGTAPNQVPDVPEKLLSYAPTYYPGTDRIAGARPVRVEIGIDAFNVTFALLPAVPVTMSGSVLDLNGHPVSEAGLSLIPTEDGGIQTDLSAKATSDASGQFVIRGVPPGTYVLQCYERALFGSKPVVVPAIKEEFSGVEITVRPRVNARGRLTFEGGPPPDRNSVTMTFVPTDSTSGPVGWTALIATLHDDWSFEFSNLAWVGLIRVSAGTGWALKSVRRGGRDITDEPSDFQSADVEGLELLMTNHLASISGIVTEGSNPAAHAFVLVLPEDATKAFQPARALMAATSGTDGSFKIDGLVAGRYRIIAVASVQNVLRPSDWVASFHPLATPVTVSADESKTMNLKLVKR